MTHFQTKTLNLTLREIEIIQSALMLAAPSGGGSEVFSLYRKIAGETEIVNSDILTRHYWETALNEYLQSCS